MLIIITYTLFPMKNISNKNPLRQNILQFIDLQSIKILFAANKKKEIKI